MVTRINRCFKIYLQKIKPKQEVQKKHVRDLIIYVTKDTTKDPSPYICTQKHMEIQTCISYLKGSVSQS